MMSKEFGKPLDVLDASYGNRKWMEGMEAMHARRATYTPERREYYADLTNACLAILQPAGNVLDVGCGDASLRNHLAEMGVSTGYLGIDPAQRDGEWTKRGAAEALPVDGPFDAVLIYSVLQHVAEPFRALCEARRVLRDGGRLCLQVSVNDQNRMFLHYWRPCDILEMVRMAGFETEESGLILGRIFCVRAVKHG